MSFPASEFYGQFGVFPVQVQAGGTGYAAVARTLLPFWPGGTAASQVKGLQAAWVWPLVDTPQQGACKKTLATSELASSVAPGGRLSTLLDAGTAWSADDQLTWDIDPALLSDVSVMTHSYFTHGNAECSERSPEPPSQAAATWLAQLGTSTAGQSAFLTPYANVDVAALSHSVLDGNIETAYRLGETVAGQILPDTFGKTGTGTGDATVLKAAWPADGRADDGVLTSLADDGGISTVVLTTDELSAAAGGGEDALAKTVSGVGTSISLLLANSRITGLLGTASAKATPSSQFALTQDFLAQTAMIAAESPGTDALPCRSPRRLTGPRRASEAQALLSDHPQCAVAAPDRAVDARRAGREAAVHPARPAQAGERGRAQEQLPPAAGRGAVQRLGVQEPAVPAAGRSSSTRSTRRWRSPSRRPGAAAARRADGWR